MVLGMDSDLVAGGKAKFATVSVKRYGKDKWRAQFPYKDAAGNWRTVSRTLKTTGRDKGNSKRVYNAAVSEADSIRARLNDEAARDSNPAHGATVAEYIGAYIAERAQSVTPTTVSGYRQLLNNVLRPALGDVALTDLNPSQVAAWLTSERESGRYTAVTIRKAFMLLKSAMKQAVERDMIAKDPTRTVKAPRPDEGKPNALDAKGRGRVAAFLDIDPTDPASIAIRLALFCGMRRGEICGLRWRNVDTDSRTLDVAESIGIADKGDLEGNATNLEYSGLYVKPPKNRKSARRVTYPATVAAALAARRAAMRAECMAAGVPFDDGMFVCGDITGRPMHPHALYRRWTATAEALGLVGTQGRAVTFHDLRHTYATTAIAHGIDVKTVSESMGHTNAAMTLNRYASADPDAARRATETLERAYAAEMAAASAAGEVIELGRTGTDE